MDPVSPPIRSIDNNEGSGLWRLWRWCLCSSRSTALRATAKGLYTVAFYGRYAIVDEAMVREAAARLARSVPGTFTGSVANHDYTYAIVSVRFDRRRGGETGHTRRT